VSTSSLRSSGKRRTSADSLAEDSRSLSSHVRRGALWSIASTLVLRMATIFITAIVAHILTPHDFGVFAVATTAYTIITNVGELGAASCLIRADLDIDALAPSMTSASLISTAVLAVVMTAFAGPIAAALGSVDGAGPIRVMALAVLLVGAFSVPSAQLTRDFKQDKLFLANVISFIASTPVLIILAKSGSGAMAFAWSRVAAQFVSGCVVVASVPRIYWPGAARSAFSVLVKFGIPLAGANFVNAILLNVDYAFVGHLMGAVALGTYVLAFNVASWPASLLGAVINSVALPALSRVKHDFNLLNKAIAGAVRAVSLVVMPMCALTIALSRPLVLTLYGARWAESANVLSVLSLYGAISIICVLFANMIASLGRTRFILAVQLVWLGTLVPAMALGVHERGIVGAAVAHIAVIGPIVLPSYLVALKKATGVHLGALMKAALPAILAATAAAFAARSAASQFATPLLQLVAGSAAGGLIYLALTAPLAIALLSHEQPTKGPLLPILRVYDSIARFARLPVPSRPMNSETAEEQLGITWHDGALRPQLVPSWTENAIAPVVWTGGIPPRQKPKAARGLEGVGP
jgi:lipopolysaccharide exporter